MIKSKHGAALEHGTVYLYCKSIGLKKNPWFSNNPYSKVVYIQDEIAKGMDNQPVYHQYITTNYRVIEDLKCPRQLQLLCSPTNFHEKRYTMRFTCSRAIAQELTRHRVFSFLMESQRYINYSKERHGGVITFIKPTWYEGKKHPMFEEPKTVLEVNIFSQDSKSYQFEKQLSSAEAAYFRLLNEGCQPQQARDVLPNATKTELIMTGFASDWRHVMDLRLFGKTGAPHPDMINLMQKAQKVMQEAGIWEDIISKPSKFE
jgi:flavin-dependent thymidylate synthase